MKNIKQLCFITKILIISFFGLTVFCGCDKTEDYPPYPPYSENGLSLRIAAINSKSDFTFGENVEIYSFIKNNSKRDHVICAWPSREEGVFVFFADEGKASYKDKISFNEPDSEKNSFITIKAGTEIQYGSFEYGKDFEGFYFDRPGHWDLKIIQFFEFSGKRFEINSWQGKLESNTLSINIMAEEN